MDLVVDLAAVLEDIGVIENRGAAGKGKLGATDKNCGPRILRRPRRPDAVVCLEPGKEIGVLARGQIARQHLVEVVVAVDQARQKDMSLEIKDHVRGRGKLASRP